MNFISQSEKETIKIARNFTRGLRGGEVICLIGELGAGKTVFAKGLAQDLGIKKLVRSPSFVLMKTYPISNNRFSISKFCHIDAFRLKAPQLVEIGALEYFNQPKTISLIEWADKVKKILPKKRIEIKIKFGRKENERRIIIQNYLKN